MATINIYQSSYVQQSGHRRRRTWQVKKKMPLLRTTPVECARNKQIVMTLRTSLLTPPDTSSEQTASSEEEYYRTRHDFGSSAPPNTTYLWSPPQNSHDKIASPSQQRVAAGHIKTDNNTTGFISPERLPNTARVPISQVLGQFWFMHMCVCVVCVACVGAGTCKRCVCVCVSVCDASFVAEHSC